MLRVYGIDLRDVVAGEHDPALVISLIEALPPGSATHAVAVDEENWRFYLDATNSYYALASIYDAVNNNTAATGNWKKKPPKFDPWPTPELMAKKKVKDKKPTSVRELFGALGAMLPTGRKG